MYSLNRIEQIYQLIAENMMDVIWLMDLNLNLTYVSPAVEKIRGYTTDELTKMKFPEHFSPESFKVVKKISKTDMNPANLIKSSVKTLGPYNLELSCRNNVYKWHEIVLFPICDKEKNEITFLGIAREITERRMFEHALKISEEKFAKAFRYSPNIQILSKMSDNTIVDVSNTFFGCTGYLKNDVIGKTISDLKCWVKKKDYSDIWYLLKNTGEVKNSEIKLKDKNGFVCDVRLSAETILIDDELYIISTLFNLSEVHKLEKKIIEISANEKYKIAHELDRSLVKFLSGITLLCRELKRKLDEKFLDESNLVGDISKLIDEAVSQIKALSRGLDPIQPDDKSIIDSIGSLAASIRNISGINCIVSKGKDIPQIDKTIARNLLLIAKEAINCAITLRNPSNIILTLDYDGDKIKLIVLDDGKFFKDEKDQVNYIIMKHIASLINGTLEINYGDYSNTLICEVILETSDVNNAENALTNKYRILVVDDQTLVRRGIVKIIEETGNLIVCGEADNFTTLVKAVRKLNPDLLICDFVLNGVFNIDLCKSISSVNPSLPVLIISNQDELIYAERLIKSGARGYIMKTETQKKITEAINNVLKGEIYMSSYFRSNIAAGKQFRGFTHGGLIINSLSERELEVFSMIGKGLHSKEIAAKLFISIKTVEAIRKRLRSKLKIPDSATLVKQAIYWTNRQGHDYYSNKN